MSAELFLANDPRLETVWRAIILYGGNSATFKFALAKTLLELRPESGRHITLAELAEPYSRNLVEHLKKADKQGTAPTSNFLKACRQSITGEVTHEKLIETTVKLGFVNVLNAFHIVDSATLSRFFDLKQSNSIRDGIVVTDNFSKLLETDQLGSLEKEAEARWRLVEAAWEMRISRRLLGIEFDSRTKLLNGVAQYRRVSLTSCRSALNSYQKGKCFYCNCTISLSNPNLHPHVDHFFPWKLQAETEFRGDVDGVWNLVLACRDCNSRKGKKLPTGRLQRKLLTRNNLLIESHHPLRETLMNQYGGAGRQRIERFHEARWKEAQRLGFIVLWEG